MAMTVMNIMKMYAGCCFQEDGKRMQVYKDDEGTAIFIRTRVVGARGKSYKVK